jgi:hypothetical protein
MNRPVCCIAPVLMVMAACTPTPSWYGVPEQHTLVGGTAEAVPAPAPSPQLGEYMCASDDGAEQYIVKDIRGLEAVWRWTNAEPELRFQLKPGRTARLFHLELGINDRTFRDTGPVKIVFEVNGHEVARHTFETFGDHTWEHRVGAELLAPGAENRVRIRVLNPWQAPDPGVKLGFVLRCAGFKPL